jgi:Tfp pilus assembly protein PilN
VSPRINLLPLSYRKARARRRRVRIGATVAVVLLGVEAMTGMILYSRGARTRELMNAAAAAREATEEIRLKMKDPAQEAARLDQQLTLARRLRTTHHWSRLLSVFSQAAPSRVVLTAISTDPSRWSPSLSQSEKAVTKTGAGQPPPSLLTGLSLHGRAADYEDMTRFISNLQNAGAFASLSLKQARRDKYQERDVIVFELYCRWQQDERVR